VTILFYRFKCLKDLNLVGYNFSVIADVDIDIGSKLG